MSKDLSRHCEPKHNCKAYAELEAENAELREQIKDLNEVLDDYLRLTKELSNALGHDAESPSLCDLVAVARLLRKRLAEVENPWIKLTNKPEKDGWYGVCYTGNKSFAMYFRTKKRHYSDSQWFVDDNTGHSWQGKLPDYYCHLPSTKQITGDL